VDGISATASQASTAQAWQDTLLGQAEAGAASGDDVKIRKSSKDFEAMLLGTWLQQAESSFASVPGGDDDDDSQRGQITGFGVQSLSNFLAQSGKFGLGNMIEHAMEKMAHKQAAAQSDDLATDAAKAG
jgi:Rod binding domain-containing protein